MTPEPPDAAHAEPPPAAPTFDDIFAVMAAASVGDTRARVPLPAELDPDDTATRFAIALNLLLDDLGLRAEEARDRERDLATTLDSIGDAVIATDVLGRVIRMNPVAERLTGWRHAEARGHPLAEVFRVVDEHARGPSPDPSAPVLEGSVASVDSPVLVARDGRERPIAHSAAPIRRDDGVIRGRVLVFRDRTEERLAEAARLRAAELQAANERFQEASRLKNVFLANMSHELRTPLNSIIGFGDLLRDEEAGPLSPIQHEFLGHIVGAGRHLLQVINDVLDLSKIEAGKMSFSPELFVAETVVADVRAILEGSARSRSIHFTTRVDEAVDPVYLDAGRLRQILYNLASNAIKFTPDGGRVDIRLSPEGPDWFRIEVEDTGIGIAPADLPRLFVEFQQLDAGTSKKHGGTGLGLALTRRLVEAQGGLIGVRSTPGVGSVFHAVLPRRAA